jgi:hypothetical protein
LDKYSYFSTWFIKNIDIMWTEKNKIIKQMTVYEK